MNSLGSSFPGSGPARAARGARRAGVLALLGVALAACTGQIENVRPAQELRAERTRPPGSVYLGWRVFLDRCARCHGVDGGGGSGGAPNLLVRVREMGQNRFTDRVLRAYEWDASVPRAEGAARERAVDDVAQRRAGALTMPAWQGEPRVTAHIADLYAYLSARAEGTQGPGRPAP
ncbi:MAG: c-type cytochrome [Rubrivivax sp.]|nr:c-type cytochrome [Rubrivivax sp.]